MNSQVSKADLTSMFKQTAQYLGLDDDASSTIIQNLNASTMPMCVGAPFTDDEEGTDDFKLIFFAIDGSTSMEDVQDEVRNGFNEDIIPSLLDPSVQNLVGGIRIGGLRFASGISPLWQAGFHPVKDLPRLTKKDYFAFGSTCLYRALIDAATAATNYTAQVFQKTGSMPEVVIAALSDGANREEPFDPQEVYSVYSQLNREIFTTVFFGFETWEQVDFTSIARGVGFRDVMDLKAKPGESPAEMRRRIRHALRVFSTRLSSRVSSSKAGAQADAGGGSGFFD